MARPDRRTPRASSFGWRRAAGALAVGLLAGCASSGPDLSTDPSIDARQVALVLEEGTRLERPVRILFDWSLNESGMRFRGRGVARLEPPYRARLDLFTGNGETVLQAALVDDELRLPRGAPTEVVPPPPLLWATLGVFRAGAGATFLGGSRRGESTLRLRYLVSDEEELRYQVRARRVEEAELLEDGHVLHRVEVAHGSDDRFPTEATYRNLGAFRELRVRMESVEYVESYPPDIWNLGA